MCGKKQKVEQKVEEGLFKDAPVTARWKIHQKRTINPISAPAGNKCGDSGTESVEAFVPDAPCEDQLSHMCSSRSDVYILRDPKGGGSDPNPARVDGIPS